MNVGDKVEVLQGSWEGHIGKVVKILSGSPHDSVYGPNSPPDDYDALVDFDEMRWVPFWTNELKMISEIRSTPIGD